MAGRARACCNFPDATAVDRGGRAPLRAHPGAAHLLVAAGAARGAQPGIAGRAGAGVPGAGLRCGAAGGGLARRPRSHLGTGARRPYGVCTAGAAVRRGRRRGARCRGAGRLCPEPRGPRSRHLRAGADRGRGSPGARARGVAHQPCGARDAALRRCVHPRLSLHPQTGGGPHDRPVRRRERARRHAGGAEGGARPPGRAAADVRHVPPFPAGVRDWPAHQ